MNGKPDFVKFARAILDGWPDGGVEMDGFELQELATDCGLLVPTMMAAPCGAEPDGCCPCQDAEATFPTRCYRRIPELIG